VKQQRSFAHKVRLVQTKFNTGTSDLYDDHMQAYQSFCLFWQFNWTR